MFPTKGKSRIPKTLSYPINDKLVYEALAGVPQANELTISFFHHTTAASRARNQPLLVMLVRYSYQKASQYTPHSFEAMGMCEPNWSIRVEAVPQPIKHHIQDLLRIEGLSKMRAWLCEHGGISGKQETHGFEIFYDEADDRLEYRTQFRPS